MARVGFRMNLKPGNEAEYKKRHDEIWPELTQLLHDTGIRNYTIFRDGLTLFAYLEIDDPAALDELPDKELMRRWWGLHGAVDGLQRRLHTGSHHARRGVSPGLTPPR